VCVCVCACVCVCVQISTTRMQEGVPVHSLRMCVKKCRFFFKRTCANVSGVCVCECLCV